MHIAFALFFILLATIGAGAHQDILPASGGDPITAFRLIDIAIGIIGFFVVRTLNRIERDIRDIRQCVEAQFETVRSEQNELRTKLASLAGQHEAIHHMCAAVANKLYNKEEES